MIGTHALPTSRGTDPLRNRETERPTNRRIEPMTTADGGEL